MAEEIKNVEEAMQDVQELTEEQLDKVVGGAGKVGDPLPMLPFSPSYIKE